jgi:hypothetical protein
MLSLRTKNPPGNVKFANNSPEHTLDARIKEVGRGISPLLRPKEIFSSDFHGIERAA